MMRRHRRREALCATRQEQRSELQPQGRCDGMLAGQVIL